ncbi:Retrovirus-related Pol polyprotein from transposon 297 [Araneus ventricosus]|uniref:Retrovirus-related Pol polyprotein from transposon 297 n=1 Tax=Araneus ventricosus TaxID=182803 RepID=A0A4Y2KPF8_ARAVE|nr:Retrovirus-related Pol polyprotein from transposon 297 [Araneus ventricosus]
MKWLKTEGPWTSPIVLVKKKYGSTRFFVDYRKLNEITKKDSYPFPRIEDDTPDVLDGSQWFTTLDLKSGYWQVEIRPEDREKPSPPDKDFGNLSNEVIGAVLSQNIGNEERVIAYFSKSLGKPERNYYITRTELLAIVKSIVNFHHYLYGWKFLLRTDHASLRWLLNFKELEGQIARWIRRRHKYDFEIQHRKGTTYGNADTLSRRPCKEYCTNAEKKIGMEIDISVKVITTTSVYPWS